jgi:hypothetical protein
LGRKALTSPVLAQGAKAAHAVAFCAPSANVHCAATAFGLARRWGDSSIRLPSGHWRNILSGKMVEGGSVSSQTPADRFSSEFAGKED